ncbi:calmodulin-like protein containing EF hand domain [Diplonema papillatum]|nr:calmodulin-like protein containing EF hand domain [Diplonema papillatum]KAJ9449773.1 calmodulin-like protein containing EF hand domain [Diplonema papillatum]|eukprot:gene17372-26699_t
MALAGGDGPFALRVAADIFGKKYNRELVFPVHPLIADLINATESQLDAVGRAHRPAGFPDVPFQAQSFQVFDDLQDKWLDLYSSQQLRPGCQLYCFQPQSIWHSDVQEGIPESTPVVTWITGTGRVTRTAMDSGIPPSHSEKLRSCFSELDAGSKGFLVFQDVINGLQRAEIQLLSCSAEQLFMTADLDGNGQVSYEEWAAFGLCPCNADLAAALYFRMKDLWTGRRKAGVGELAVIAKREAAQKAEKAQEEAWHARRAVARQTYDDAQMQAVLARQQADEASAREQETYVSLYV